MPPVAITTRSVAKATGSRSVWQTSPVTGLSSTINRRALVAFDDAAAFFNANTLEELKQLQERS